jgi:hypothetical protein
MAREIGLQEAAEALRRHYGGKGVEAGRDEGLDLMVNAMRQELGISRERAEQLVNELEKAHRIHWVARGVAPATPESRTQELVPGTVEHHTGQVSADPGARGYWQVE